MPARQAPYRRLLGEIVTEETWREIAFDTLARLGSHARSNSAPTSLVSNHEVYHWHRQRRVWRGSPRSIGDGGISLATCPFAYESSAYDIFRHGKS